MQDRSPEKGASRPGQMPAEPSRDERRKAALKANMARRKAQARARAEGAAVDGTPTGGADEQDQG